MLCPAGKGMYVNKMIFHGDINGGGNIFIGIAGTHGAYVDHTL